MNKIIKTVAVMALACVTLCGTAMAAPRHHGGRGPKPAPVHHRAPAHHPHAHWAPPPPPVVHVHHGGNGLAVLGGAIVGGIVGALVR